METRGHRVDNTIDSAIRDERRSCPSLLGATGRPTVMLVGLGNEALIELKRALEDDHDVSVVEEMLHAAEACARARPLGVVFDAGAAVESGEREQFLRTLNGVIRSAPGSKAIVLAPAEAIVDGFGARVAGAGAHDILDRAGSVGEVQRSLARAIHLARLEWAYREGQRWDEARHAFEGMLGASDGMRHVFQTIRKVGVREVPVLILGESGTGKERVANAIHRCGSRRGGPFVAINCGAIPENLLESELFGHEKGSFTGAHASRPGRVESAAGGTLFLDEVGELPLPLQVKLLRFLQERRFERVGGRKEISADVRVVAATNVQIEKSLAAGRFREDLYYRLAVVVLRLPPLRERGDDIGILADAFLRRFAAENHREDLMFDPSALHALNEHLWPGNVRELENRIRRAVIMTDGSRIRAADLELGSADSSHGEDSFGPTTLREARERVERQLILDALRRHRGNVSAVALELDVSRPTIAKLMERFHIERRALV